MADLLSVHVIGDRNLIRNLDQMPDTVRAILVEKTRVLTEQLASKVRDNIEARLTKTQGRSKQYSGSPIHLRDAVETLVMDDSEGVEGLVFIGGIPYAKAQESGAATGPHMIFPKNGKLLAFTAATGDKVMATRVLHPGGQIPATWFMKDAYREMGPRISREMKNAVVQGIRASMRAGR